jgi:SAM-dependent methyltransferase
MGKQRLNGTSRERAMAQQMPARDQAMQDLWDESFRDQIASGAYNTAPVEALVRFVSHYLRDRYPDAARHRGLRFLEVGSGAGPNLVWLAEKGIEANGVDISPSAVKLCRQVFEARGMADRLGRLEHASATALPFEDNSLDGVLESCVFQHLNREDRAKAHAEVVRVLKPGGLFVGHMISNQHSTYLAKKHQENPADPGTLDLETDASPGKVHLESIGLAHFFAKEEYADLLKGCSVIDPCETTYELPGEEAKRRGYDYYRQAMWIVYAVK